ncbi:MAG TPA: aminotransferase class I/II-fold pyridoxal phosphate-dependent enzyme [Gemmatimonadaceae bacterium]|nr:aminotransferase class I/II-fold pyridoxal phosphate-dependent enzyme [Gemmatimonadaceae bacterium]
MDFQGSVSRRRFLGGAAATAGALALSPNELAAWTQYKSLPMLQQRAKQSEADWDSFAKVNFNENPYGPYESVMQAMQHAFKFANRYGYPDDDIGQAIAELHGAKGQHIVMGAGSGEILDVVGLSYLTGTDKRVIGSDPSYGSVYQQATTIKADAIKIPLLPDYRQDIPAIIDATKKHYRDVGFIYLCNPNNPTGRIVTKKEIKHLLDEIPEDVPVLIDEAYHHFVEDSEYASSTSYALEGRPVIVTRTFSKIAALAGMRLGYAVTTPEIAQRLRAHQTGTINALVKWAGAAALRDTAEQARVKKVTLELRKKAMADLASIGYETIPSETNFFMVHLKRPVQPVIDEFAKRKVLVGRPFPPMMEHLRVSVGNADEMARFASAFREIMTTGAATGSRGG